MFCVFFLLLLSRLPDALSQTMQQQTPVSPMITVPVQAYPVPFSYSQDHTDDAYPATIPNIPSQVVEMPPTYVQAPNTPASNDIMTQPIPTSTEQLPDLTLDTRPGILDYDIQEQYFDASNCAVIEGCARAGNRRLLRFNSNIINVGNADLVLGDPRLQANSAFFHWSECHQHYHRGDVLIARLRNPRTGQVVGQGNKIGVCMEDSISYFSNNNNKIYNCYQQGIQKGWADIYTKDLDCQYVDITDVPPGSYDLEMEVNANHRIKELNYENNKSVVRVQI